jgi:hypothetical protein
MFSLCYILWCVAFLGFLMSIFTYIWQFFFVRKMNTIKNDLRVVTDFPFICHQKY